MKALSITPLNFEDIALKEIEELLGKKGKKARGLVVFNFSDYKELIRFCYLSQSSRRVLVLLGDFCFSSKDEFLKKAKESLDRIDFGLLKKAKSFRVSYEGNLSFKVNELFGELILKKLEKENKKIKVNLEEPEIIFYVYTIDNHCYFGIDFSGDLEKRDYRVFNSQKSIKGVLAYCLVRLSNFSKDKVLVDCFTSSGEIPIEAALFSVKKSVHFFNKDKFNFLKFVPSALEELENIDREQEDVKTKIYAIDSKFSSLKLAKQNAKIAGINKKIRFSRLDVGWLDTKFKKGEVDCIVSRIKEVSKRNREEEVKKLYKEFFYNAEFILNKNGKIVLLLRKIDLLKDIAEEYGFKLEEKREVFLGKARFYVVVFVR